MIISNNTKKELEEYLSKWISELTDRKKIEYTKQTEITRSVGAKNKSFHEALLPKDVIRAIDFERSFSTGLGSTFENCAYIIAKSKFAVVERQYILENYIPTDTISEVDKVITELNEKKKFSNYQQEVRRIVELSIKDTSNKISRSVITDLYIKDDADQETFFELKSPKPNKEQCLTVTRKQLLIHCIRKRSFPKTRTYFGMAYNPNGEGNEYGHSFSKTYLDIKHHVIIGKNLWDYIGGKGTYEELLDIYQKVGKDKGMELVRKTLLT